MFLITYGTDDCPYGSCMVGGPDVTAIYAMVTDKWDDILKRRAEKEKITHIGEYIKVGEFEEAGVWTQEAADSIDFFVDEGGRVFVKLTIRKSDPGTGLFATPGGFGEHRETTEKTARREGEEETGVSGGPTKAVIDLFPVKGDVRVWRGTNRPEGVKNGDMIALITSAIITKIVGKRPPQLRAGDDATATAWFPLDLLDANMFGIKAHAEMIIQGAEKLELTVPDSFRSGVENRQDDIRVATRQDQHDTYNHMQNHRYVPDLQPEFAAAKHRALRRVLKAGQPSGWGPARH